MIGNKIKKIIEEKTTTINIETIEDQKAFARLEAVISKIKYNLNAISNNEIALKMNAAKNTITVTNTKEIFGSPIYSRDTYSDNRSDVGFFSFYRKSGFQKTLDDFKIWLDENGIEKVVIGWTHCGGGRDSWNIYSVKLK